MRTEILLVLLLLTGFSFLIAGRYFLWSRRGSKDNNNPEVQSSIPKDRDEEETESFLPGSSLSSEAGLLREGEADPTAEKPEAGSEIPVVFQRRKRKSVFFKDLSSKKELRKALIIDELIDRKPWAEDYPGETRFDQGRKDS
jgi:hypothetical protein